MEGKPIEKKPHLHGTADRNFEEREENGKEKVSQKSKEELIEIKPREEDNDKIQLGRRNSGSSRK